MRHEVTTYLQYCVTCQQKKVSQQLPSGLLQPLNIPMQVWDDLPMDLIEGLPMSKGVNSRFMVVDRLSKYTHFIGPRHLFDDFTVASGFIKKIVRLHGLPMSII